MEDRNLFKAKRLDNGEWVTGSLITCKDGTCKIATSCLEGKADEPILVYTVRTKPKNRRQVYEVFKTD